MYKNAIVQKPQANVQNHRPFVQISQKMYKKPPPNVQKTGATVQRKTPN